MLPMPWRDALRSQRTPWRSTRNQQNGPSNEIDGPVGREGFEPPKHYAAGLQPAPFGHLGISPWSRRWDSNPQPAVYKTAALPIELRRQPRPNQVETQQ